MTQPVDPGDFSIVRNLGLVDKGFASISSKRSQPLRRKVCRVGRWQPPPDAILKINIDGSSHGNPGKAGVGGIVRDMDDNVIFIFSIHKGVHSNNVMEALAIKLAMERACSLGWRRMVCESDSQIVVDMINNQRVDDSSWKIASLVREILHLSSFVDGISFCHIPREWNGVADVLAKWASEKGTGWDISDRDDLPTDYGGILEQLVERDRT